MGMWPRRAWLCVGAAAIAATAPVWVYSRAESKRVLTNVAAKAAPADPVEAARLNSIGVAYMNQQRFPEGQKQFEGALAADPSYALAKLNLGVSLLAQQKSELAKVELTTATEKLPNDPYAWYNLGLAYKDLSDPEKAIASFKKVAEIAPTEPDAFYFIGYLSTQLQRYDEAISAFQKALAIAPNHASAEFGLARAYQRKGDSDAAREHMQKFQRITTNHLGSPFGAGFGDQGKFSQAEFAKNDVPQAPAAIPVKYVPQNFDSLLSGANKKVPGPSMGACFFDFDGDGKTDLYLVSAAAGQAGRLLHNVGAGKFEDVTEASGLVVMGSGFGCAAGDYDNDGKTDIAICAPDGVRLFHNEGNGKFAEATAAAGIKREKGCVGLSFVDYDHDGDLDLYITAASGGKNALWRNNGNSTFTDVSEETAMGVSGTGGGMVSSDFNNDRAIDFVLPGGMAGAAIYLNPREGKFTQLPGIDFAKEKLPPAVGVAAFDFDKDGWMDLAFTHAGAPGISLWRNVEGKQLERVALPDFGWQKGWGITALDYDNDGWLDLVAVGETAKGGEIRLLRNGGGAGWKDVTKDTQLDAVKLSAPRSVAVADLRGTGEPDLVITQADASPVILKNDGAAKNNWVQLDLKPLNDNRSAVGTKIEIYAGPLYQKWEVQSASGYLGQNGPTFTAGLAAAKGADVVRLLWPTGVPQDEIQLAGRKVNAIGELDRRGSSCPVLFSWNGHEYEFIADMIGPGVVGHWIAPGERDVPDPTEYLKVDAKSVAPKNGLLSFRFMEPMEETVYMDQVKLLAIDHPADLTVYPNERFVTAPPFPEFRVIASKDAHAPAGAWDDKGNDVSALLAKRDRKYVTDFADEPFTGFAKLHWVELDLGEWSAAKPLRLILDGYTDYFTATSMYAADQAGVKVIAPYVEVQDAQGNWKKVVEDMGFPAGLARTMVADLSGKIPEGTKRIRIVTNLKVYWDAIRVDQTEEQKGIRVQEVPMKNAELAYFGYPKENRLTPASDTTYNFNSRSKTGPYARAAGNYTRYGDVKSLLSKSDEHFTIFSSGEGLKLDFDPGGLKPLPQGWVRDYFFYADGFEKDLDFYAAHAFTVEPLPRHGMIAYPYPEAEAYPSDKDHVRYQLEFNTRQGSGKLPADLQYRYKK